MPNGTSKHAEAFPASFRWAGYTLGFGIGGFFDGILLHQVLQFHHLLSGLEEPQFQDLRVQILADGLFHVAMYAIAAVGLFLLWLSRAHFPRPVADRLLTANALIGFGAWHVIDGILSHWVLRLHRIKMDSDIPLFWDLAWFTVFGVLFIVAGLLLRPRGPAHGKKGGSAAAAAALLAIVGGAGAAVPPSDRRWWSWYSGRARLRRRLWRPCRASTADWSGRTPRIRFGRSKSRRMRGLRSCMHMVRYS